MQEEGDNSPAVMQSCVCRMAGQAGTSFNKTAVPLPGGGNAA